ncbi:MAG: chorismate synthase [Lachnospiraceae bacterium]|jgi:chorismate synthase|nr:chorismate synthase [Lachnospiraceae bacterium]
MAGSSIGTILRMTTWGESHGKGIGAVVDGVPAGLELCEADIQGMLDRRRPGQSPYATARQEADLVEILSGVFEGLTTGTPISLLVRNTDQRSRDYSEIKDIYRPGHADFGFDAKYGFRDYRGGGRSSGRETTARVAAGAIAKKLLERLGIEVHAYTLSVGPVHAPSPLHHRQPHMTTGNTGGSDDRPANAGSGYARTQSPLSPDGPPGPLDDRLAAAIATCRQNPLYMPDAGAAARAQSYLEGIMAHCDSAGGVVECVITGMPPGVGEPVFDKLSARLAQAICSIGAVKGFEIGDGFQAAESLGTTNNDAFALDSTRRVTKTTNHAGGILGGLSDGSPITVRAAIKPTASISLPQRTVTRDAREVTTEIKGRHDPIIVPRAVVVVESMAAFTVADLLLVNMTSRMENLERCYCQSMGV